MVTAHALHTQRGHADWLVTQRQTADVLVVRADQAMLHHQLRRRVVVRGMIGDPQ
jgi:hypothetical protein